MNISSIFVWDEIIGKLQQPEIDFFHKTTDGNVGGLDANFHEICILPFTWGSTRFRQVKIFKKIGAKFAEATDVADRLFRPDQPAIRGHRPLRGLRPSFFRIRFRNTRLIKSDAAIAIYCHRSTFIRHRSALRPLMISADRGAPLLLSFNTNHSPLQYANQDVPVKNISHLLSPTDRQRIR